MIGFGSTQIIGGLAAVTLIGGGAFKVGMDRGYDRAERQFERHLERVQEEARELVDRCRVERDQARAEVDKVNAAVSLMREERNSIIESDRQSRQAAADEMDVVARYAARMHEESVRLVNQAREILDNAQDTCASVDVGDDLHGVLNALANPPAIIRDSGLPPASDDN